MTHRPAAARAARGLGGGDPPAAAQPHQRPPRLHAVPRRSSNSATNDPHGYVSPDRDHRLGARRPARVRSWLDYGYSNTDNIVVGLIAETVTGTPSRTLLKKIVFGPAGLRQTSLPEHGLDSRRRSSTATWSRPASSPRTRRPVLSPSGAWASGAIVSTPRDLDAFIRADLGLRFFGAAQQREQMRFVPGGFEPARPRHERRRASRSSGTRPRCGDGLRPHRQLPRLRRSGPPPPPTAAGR